MTVRTFLDLSSAHVCQETVRRLNDGYLSAANSETGWFVWAGANDDDIPPDLQAIFAKAKELGCDYVCIDGDAVKDDTLPEYEW